MNGDQLTMKSIAVPGSAFQHSLRVGPRRDPHENSFLRTPELFDPVAGQISLQLLVHYVRGKEKRDLAQFRELHLIQARRSGGLPIIGSIDAVIGWNVDNDNLIRHLQEAERHRLLDML